MLFEAFDLLQHTYRRFGIAVFDPRFFGTLFSYASGRRTLPLLKNIEQQPLSFPRDHKAHDATIEWWYFNGFVESSQKRRFALHYVLFYIRPKMFGFSGILGLNKLVSVTYSFVKDLDRAFLQKQVAMPVFAEVGFQDNAFTIQDPLMDLRAQITHKPLPVHGDGFVAFPLDPMMYYSLPRLALQGDVVVNGERVSVEGTGWFDHQWGNRLFQQYAWTWMCVMFDNGYNLVACYYGTQKHQAFLTLQKPDGTIVHVDDVRCVSLDAAWISPRTKREYKTMWHVESPSIGLKLDIVSDVDDYELSLGYIHYFEAPIEVTGTLNNHRQSGRGFIEITRSRSL